MQKKIGIILFIASILTILWLGYTQLRVDYWLKPPSEKLSIVWSTDIKNLEKSKMLPPQWQDVKEVVVKTDNSPLLDWTAKLKPPISTNTNGHYRLEVFFVLLLDGNRYGTVVEYDLIEISTKNKIWELGRTYKLGLFY
jgi:hypothetical protein